MEGCANTAIPEAAASQRTVSSPTMTGLTITPRHPASRARARSSWIAGEPRASWGKYTLWPPVSPFACDTASWQRATRSRNGAVGWSAKLVVLDDVDPAEREPITQLRELLGGEPHRLEGRAQEGARLRYAAQRADARDAEPR